MGPMLDHLVPANFRIPKGVLRELAVTTGLDSVATGGACHTRRFM